MAAPPDLAADLVRRLAAKLGCERVVGAGSAGEHLAADVGLAVAPPEEAAEAIVLLDAAGDDGWRELARAAPATVVLAGGGEDRDALEARWAGDGLGVAWRGALGEAVLVLAPPAESRTRELLEAGARGLLLDAAAGPLPEDDALDAALRRLRVAIVSFEFVGPTRTGGIGTANTALAETLAAAGAHVDALFTGWHGDGAAERLAEARERYAAAGVALHALDAGESRDVLQPYFHARRAADAYRWLRRRDADQPYDVVHLPECGGHGAYVLAAKRAGLAFARTTIAVETHGSSRWVRESNREPFGDPELLAADPLERRSVEQADIVISPSEYMVDDMRRRGWRVPARTFVQQYVEPPGARPERVERPRAARLAEVVFFGRQETRKGLQVFLGALDRLAAQGGHDDLAVTVLGRGTRVDGEPSEELIARRAAAWPWTPRVVTDLDQREALAYLRERDCLAVMPSLVDNLPLAVLEALALGVPFLTTRVGGTAELIDPRDRERFTVDPDPGALAAGIARAVADPPSAPARFAVAPDVNRAAHLRWHAALAGRGAAGAEPAQEDEEGPARLEVALTHGGDPTPLARRALERQDGAGFELLPGPLPRALEAATGDHVLLFSPRHVMRRRALAVLRRAARRTGADVVAFGVAASRGGAIVPVGGPALLGLLHDPLSAGSVLVRRGVLDVPPGELEGDDALRAALVRFALRGGDVLVLPEVLADEQAPGGEDAVLRARSLGTAPAGDDARAARTLLGDVAPLLPEPLRDLPAVARRLDAAARDLRGALTRAEHRVLELEADRDDAKRRLEAAEARLAAREAELVDARKEIGVAVDRLATLRNRRVVRLALAVARLNPRAWR
jgi:glycosyltransferase involved in cell wall biosynthesis